MHWKEINFLFRKPHKIVLDLWLKRLGKAMRLMYFSEHAFDKSSYKHADFRLDFQYKYTFAGDEKWIIFQNDQNEVILFSCGEKNELFKL